jgi:hypothetical protein
VRRRRCFRCGMRAAPDSCAPGAWWRGKSEKTRLVCLGGDSRIRRRPKLRPPRTRRHFGGCEFSAPMTTASMPPA